MSLPVRLGGSFSQTPLVNALLASLRQIPVPGQLEVDTGNRGLSPKTISFEINLVPVNGCLVVLECLRI